MNTLRHKVNIGAVLFACTGLFLLFFSYATSPLYPRIYGDDSAFFHLVGWAMKNGRLPYVDFYDTKGPYLFFFEYLGQNLCHGRLGSFFIQYISLFITIVYAYRISGLFLTKYRFITLISIFSILAYTMQGGNLTEELSLPFLFVPLYYALCYLQNKTEHPWCYGFLYGVSFGTLALLRITNAALVCAIVLTVTIILLIEKKYHHFFVNVISFIIGVICTTIPVVIYYAFKGALWNLIDCVFIFAFKYSAEKIMPTITVMSLYLLLLLPFCILVISRNSIQWKYQLLLVTGFFATTIVISIGEFWNHYFTLVLPLIFLSVCIIISNFTTIKYKKIVVTLGVVLLLFMGMLFLKSTKYSIENMMPQAEKTYYQAMDISKYIPKQEYNSVYGYAVSTQWFSITDIIPYNKYCDWQEHYISLSPSIETEIMQMFYENPPIWLITYQEPDIRTTSILEEIQNSYEKYYENERYILYRRRK